MSVSVIRLSDNKLINYAKGADSVVTKLLNNRNYLEKNVIEELETYNATGYRTLCFASRFLTKEQAGVNVFQKDVEKDYDLLGVTGIEDLLQDNVKESIQEIKDAGIKVIMVTGDNGTTAHQLAK